MTTLGGDIKFFPSLTNGVTLGPAEIEVVAGANDVTRDPGLQTAVMIAIFTDCRADLGDPLPFDADGRGGWFGEGVLEEKFGSKLWLLRRSNLTNATLSRAKEYIEDALDRHIINERVAKSYEVEVTRENNRMRIRVQLVALDNLTPLYEYYINWQSQVGSV